MRNNCSGRHWLYCCLGGFILLASTSAAQTESRWTFAVRVVAERDYDADIIRVAADTAHNAVMIDGVLRAEWVPLAAGVTPTLTIPDRASQRLADDGTTEVLVLVSDADITEADIDSIAPLDEHGKRISGSYEDGVKGLLLHVKPESENRLLTMTRDNIGRCVATISDGQIYTLPIIRSPIINALVFRGDFDAAWYDGLLARLDSHIWAYRDEPVQHYYYWLSRVGMALVAALLPLAALVLCYRLRHKPPPSKALLILCLIVGAFTADALVTPIMHSNLIALYPSLWLATLPGGVLGVALTFAALKIAIHYQRSLTKPTRESE